MARILRNNIIAARNFHCLHNCQANKENSSLGNWEIRTFCAELNHVKESGHLYTNKRQQN